MRTDTMKDCGRFRGICAGCGSTPGAVRAGTACTASTQTGSEPAFRPVAIRSAREPDILALTVPRKLLFAASLLLILAAVAYAASFFVSDIVNQWRSEHEFSAMVADASNYGDADVESQLENARRYNQAIAGQARGGQVGYDGQLTLLGGDVLCWLEIPRLSLKVPVYRGSQDASVMDERLMAGAVHLCETSLPVGGASTHAVVTAHSGMRNARMFDQIDLLEAGDAIIVHVLGESLFYEVSGQETVGPGKVDKLGVEAGQDLLTLVTCRPIGVNTDRLLVHATRGGKPDAGQLPKTADWLISPRTLLFVTAMAVAAVALGTLSLAWSRSRQEQERSIPQAATPNKARYRLERQKAPRRHVGS